MVQTANKEFVQLNEQGPQILEVPDRKIGAMISFDQVNRRIG
jgi:hypothetical protein